VIKGNDLDSPVAAERPQFAAERCSSKCRGEPLDRPARLAIAGGTPVRVDEFPPRRVFGAEDRAAVDEFFATVVETGQDFRYGGPFQRAYEEEFARYHGGGYALLLSSGTAALYVALGALGLKRPGEVIVPAITDAGGMMPVPLLGLVPVVADTEPSSFNVGVRQIERSLTRWTRAIVVAHVGGEPVDMEPVTALGSALACRSSRTARRPTEPATEARRWAHSAILESFPL
jgi:DegT/DnrJ/EryC1/StrS aminotransferase family